MTNDSENEKNLESLRKILLKDFSWPSVYMFKLIIPSDNRTLALVRQLFPDEARVFLRDSNSGKYIIVTVKELMISVDEVIDRYRQALAIEGVIML